MPCHTPRVYVQVINHVTGEPTRSLGPYASAAAARTACGTLVWTREDQDWVAELNGHEYRIPDDVSIDA